MIAVVAVIIILLAASGVYWYATKDNGDDANKVTFLVQDDTGVYFWMSGSGETAMDALDDAVTNFGYDDVYEESSGWITSFFGLSTALNDNGNYSWWGQFTWKDGAWSYNDTVVLSDIKSSDVSYILINYGEGTMTGMDLPATTPTPSDAKVWNHSTNGVVFAIESESGLYFYINGTGTTVYDALENATSNYNIEFTGSEWSSGKAIKTIFDFGTVNNDGVYTYWNTKVLSDDGTSWETSEYIVGNLESSENAQICLLYSTGVGTPTAPVYSA
ncbi:MAG: hypothetical protein WCS15_11805 [Prevotella sp.]